MLCRVLDPTSAQTIVKRDDHPFDAQFTAVRVGPFLKQQVAIFGEMVEVHVVAFARMQIIGRPQSPNPPRRVGVDERNDVVLLVGSAQHRQARCPRPCAHPVRLAAGVVVILQHDLQDAGIDFHRLNVLDRRDFTQGREDAAGGWSNHKYTWFRDQSVHHAPIGRRKADVVRLGVLRVVTNHIVREVVIEEPVVGYKDPIRGRDRVEPSDQTVIRVLDAPATRTSQEVLTRDVRRVGIHQPGDVQGVVGHLPMQQQPAGAGESQQARGRRTDASGPARSNTRRWPLRRSRESA